MTDKKQPAIYKTIGVTKFVASAQINEMSGHLADLPQIKSRVIFSLNNHIDYRVRLRDGSSSKPVYISMRQWNQDETLIMLSYYLPTRLKIFAILFTIALLVAGGFVYVVFDSPLLFFIGWGLAIFAMLYSRATSTGTFAEYQYDETKRAQDGILDIIIDGFKQKVELNIIS